MKKKNSDKLVIITRIMCFFIIVAMFAGFFIGLTFK